MSHARRRWSDLPKGWRVAIVALGSCELVLTLAAAVDLCRRPSEEIRGGKLPWWPAIVVQPVGPIAYLTLARRREPTAPPGPEAAGRGAGRTEPRRTDHPAA